MSYEAIADWTARQREAAQAAPRPSRVRFFVMVRGVGETRLEGTRSIRFGAAMLEEPSFTFGVTARQTLDSGQVPLATACVLSYDVDSRGFYLGANVGFHVESAKPDIKLKFSLVFEGTALRSTYGLEG